MREVAFQESVEEASVELLNFLLDRLRIAHESRLRHGLVLAAKKYGRDQKAAESHNYAAGIYVAQVVTETIKRAKEAGLEINKKNLYETLNKMNGANAYQAYSAVGPVTYSKTDRTGVDMAQIYSVQTGVFKKVGEPIQSEYMK